MESPLAHWVLAGQAGCETGDLGGLLPGEHAALWLTHTGDEGDGSRALVGDEENERAVDADLDLG